MQIGPKHGMCSLSRVQLSVTPWTVAHQASLFMGFSRQEYWSGLPFPSPLSMVDYLQKWLQSLLPLYAHDFAILSSERWHQFPCSWVWAELVICFEQ